MSEDDVRGWYKQIKDYFDENNLFHILSDPRRVNEIVFNWDETNFFCAPKQVSFWVKRRKTRVWSWSRPVQNFADCYVYFLRIWQSYFTDGHFFPNKRLPAEITSKIPEDWGVGLSDNGWMKSDIFYEYIKNVLHPHLVQTGIIFPVILFVDGHKSHLTYAVSEVCFNLQIFLIALYPNCTRLLQPANVSAFKPLKSGWQKTVLEWRQNNPSVALTKNNFVPLLVKTIKNTITASTVINRFRTTGLCPWNMIAVDYRKCLGKTNISQAERLIIKRIMKNQKLWPKKTMILL